MKEESIFIIAMTLITIASIVSAALSKVLIEKQRTLIDLQHKEIARSYANTDEVLEYCLRDILKQSIADGVEDFETAARCQKLLEQLRQR
jgi:hypothetical protein